VDREQINQVAHRSAPGSGHHLIDGKINRMQDVAEDIVRHRGEETEVAVNDPFKTCARIPVGDFGSVNAWQLPHSLDAEPLFLKGGNVGECGGSDSVFTVVEFMAVT
jgi:hypothetical protein